MTPPSGAQENCPKFNLLTGTTALAAVSTLPANATIVQITLTDNFISSTVNSLNADLTGNGNADIFITNTAFSTPASGGFAVVAISGQTNVASYYTDSSNYYAVIGGTANIGSNPQTLTGIIPFSFTHSRINDGQETEAWLEITAENFSFDDHQVTLNRIIFDDEDVAAPGEPLGGFGDLPESPVPEPSSLALLALGAGGLTLRRKRKAA